MIAAREYATVAAITALWALALGLTTRRVSVAAITLGIGLVAPLFARRGREKTWQLVLFNVGMGALLGVRYWSAHPR
jgi:branched-subunit amino acid transport protein